MTKSKSDREKDNLLLTNLRNHIVEQIGEALPEGWEIAELEITNFDSDKLLKSLKDDQKQK